MKTKHQLERVAFRRGQQESAALQHLQTHRSDWVPSFNSDNQWLRFAVRLLAELLQLADKQGLTFRVGDPDGDSQELQLIGAAPNELSSGSGEVRLRWSERAQLDRVRVELGSTSRSAALRHALFACQQVCSAVANGSRLWVVRGGERRMLPDLHMIAASLDQVPHAAIKLLTAEAQAEKAPAQEEGLALLSGDPEYLSEMDLREFFGNRPVVEWSSNQLLDALGCRSLDIVAKSASSNERICVRLGVDRETLFMPIAAAEPPRRSARIGANAPVALGNKVASHAIAIDEIAMVAQSAR